jgi:putative endonuclease
MSFNHQQGNRGETMLTSHTQKTPLQNLGHAGEEAVVLYLQKTGYTIAARNYTITKGEVDIIACKDDVIAFVEVKARSKLYFNLSQVIIPTKQRRIIAAARHYIFRHGIAEKVYRFDVALLARTAESLASAQPSWDITYIRDAFTDMEAFL